MIFFYIVGWFIFAHTVLLRLFTCFKRKNRLNVARVALKSGVWPILSAHRGGSKERAENTVHAFRNAMSSGANLLECDVHLTTDGVVMVAHD